MIKYIHIYIYSYSCSIPLSRPLVPISHGLRWWSHPARDVNPCSSLALSMRAPAWRKELCCREGWRNFCPAEKRVVHKVGGP